MKELRSLLVMQTYTCLLLYKIANYADCSLSLFLLQSCMECTCTMKSNIFKICTLLVRILDLHAHTSQLFCFTIVIVQSYPKGTCVNGAVVISLLCTEIHLKGNIM